MNRQVDITERQRGKRCDLIRVLKDDIGEERWIFSGREFRAKQLEPDIERIVHQHFSG